MINTKLFGIYLTREKAYLKQKVAIERELKWLTSGRLAVSLLLLSLIFFFYAKYPVPSLLAGIASAVALGWMINRYEKQKDRSSFLEQLIVINREESMMHRGNYSHYDNGTEYIEPEHPFASDLDLFGENSLFQYINRTCTLTGRHTLAGWMKHLLLQPNEITTRQQIVKQIALNLTWRQTFQATGKKYKEEPGDRQQIESWLLEPNYFLKKRHLIWLRFVLPALTISCIIGSFAGLLHYSFGAILFLFQLGLIGVLNKHISRQYSSLDKKYPVIAKYAELVKVLEERSFESEGLDNIGTDLSKENIPATKRFADLASILNALDNRNNAVGSVLTNGLYMRDLHSIIRLEQWKEDNHRLPLKWIKAIGEIDAYISLAVYSYNHPAFSYPVFEESSFRLEAKGLAHPLLMVKKRVGNDIKFDEPGILYLVTGANMAGKSTFLRSIGVNIVLAQMGAPVCASYFSLTPTLLFTGMRSVDSLSSHQSYFFSEILRLRQMMDYASTGQHVFVLLDEILKGTNSTDQHTGTSSFIKKLLMMKCTGLIATHDIALGELESELNGQIVNYCFEIKIEDEKLTFDYQFKRGVNQTMNATFLMKQLGIIS